MTPTNEARPAETAPNTWLSRDDAEIALWKAISAIKLGNKTDDKLILKNLREAGLWLAFYAEGGEQAPTPDKPVDLGADAERGAGKRKHCSCAEVAGEDPRCFKHGEGTMWRKENPDVCLMNDALHEAIASPKGVVPPSAEPFYSHRLAALMSPPASVDATIERYREALTEAVDCLSDVADGNTGLSDFSGLVADWKALLSATPTHPDQEGGA